MTNIDDKKIEIEFESSIGDKTEINTSKEYLYVESILNQMIDKPDYTTDSISLSGDSTTLKSVIANFIIKYNQVNWDVDLDEWEKITEADYSPEVEENQVAVYIR